jgi:hypothetical protein
MMLDGDHGARVRVLNGDGERLLSRLGDPYRRELNGDGKRLLSRDPYIIATSYSSILGRSQTMPILMYV